MKDTKGPVTIINILDDHAEAVDIRQLFKRDGLALHLPPDRMRFFCPAGYPCLDTDSCQPAADFIRNTHDKLAAFLLLEVQSRFNGSPSLRIKLGEGKVLELVTKVLHPHAPGQRRIDIHGFLGNAAPAGRFLDVLKGAHVVQAVSQLYQQDPHILGDREDQFTEVLRLLRFLTGEFQPRQLRDAIHQLGNLFSEKTGDLIVGGIRILDRVVQQCGHDGGRIKLEVRQDAGHLERMREIRITRGTLLRTVHLHRVHIGPVEQAFIRSRRIGLHALNQLILADHRAVRAVSARFQRIRENLGDPSKRRMAIAGGHSGRSGTTAVRDVGCGRTTGGCRNSHLCISF